jgi:CRISPR-associated endonuclease Csn1
MTITLGLDLGPNSIGWACIDTNNEKILGLGNRIFQEGVSNYNQGKEASKNESRRLARQSRRQYARKAQRKDKLKNILRLLGMFPEKQEGEQDFFEPDRENPSNTIYRLRKKGLDEKLTKLEFGRVLYHLNQRRGFKSSLKSGQAKDDNKIIESTNELEKKMAETNSRTLGEYLAHKNPIEERLRGRYTLRAMYVQEFDMLWENQKRYYPELTDAIKKNLKEETIFHQRPLKSVSHLIGKCSLEPEKRRCHKNSLDFQQYRILEQVNRLEFIDPDGVIYNFSRKAEEPFAPEIKKLRDTLTQELWKKEDRKFEQIKKLLGFPKETTCNLEQGGEKRLLGNRSGTRLAKVFGKTWWEKPLEERDLIQQVVFQADDPDWLENYAQEKWHLTQEQAEKLARKTSFEQGCAHFSKKAIRKLTPYLQEGLNLADAKEKAGYTNQETYESFEDFMNTFRNPIVSQTLHELARLVRKIELTYGKPDEVLVELVRDLKLPAKKRRKIHFENLERKEEHQKIGRELEAEGIPVNHDSILKYKLWEECKYRCPYTNATISFDDLFRNPNFQIEHIIPYSRSLDDSFPNKTLCRIDENNKKGNKTPYEFYEGTEHYEQILQRIKILPFNKQRKFRQKDIGDDFISRQLNDTAYISRMSQQLLAIMGYKTKVSKGQATAELRHLWGLNSLLSKNSDGPALKNRDDHRHHALDAAVVAMTDSKILRKLSNCNKFDRSPTRNQFEKPWASFREDMEPHIKRLLVSHRIQKRVRGGLHEETLYGKTEKQDDKGQTLYAVRKPLDALQPAMVAKIADPTVREIVKERLRSLGVDPEQKKFTIPKNAFKDNPLYMKTLKGQKIPIKKVRIHQPFNNMVLLSGRNKTGVEPGKNHHIVIYQYQDKHDNLRQAGDICTLFEAVRRLKNKEPVIRRDLGDGKKFICSLAINELVLLDMEESQIDWHNPDYLALSQKLYRVQKMSNNITFRHHLTSILKDENENEIGRQIKTPNSFKGLKITIDRLGRVRKAND